MNTMYDSVMKMEELLGVYEHLIDDLASYMKDNHIDPTADNSVHPAIMLYGQAGRNYARLLHTRKLEDLLRMEGEYNLICGMVSELRAGAWSGLLSRESDSVAM